MTVFTDARPTRLLCRWAVPSLAYAAASRLNPEDRGMLFSPRTAPGGIQAGELAQ